MGLDSTRGKDLGLQTDIWPRLWLLATRSAGYRVIYAAGEWVAAPYWRAEPIEMMELELSSEISQPDLRATDSSQRKHCFPCE